jgi:Glycosyl transferase family 2
MASNDFAEHLANGCWRRITPSIGHLADLPGYSTSWQWLVDLSGQEFPTLTAQVIPEDTIGWLGSGDYLKLHHIDPSLSNLQIATALARQPVSILGLGAPVTRPKLSPQPSSLSLKSRILAIIPHKDCQDWLESAILSLLWQTRPIEAIAVVDDCSVQLPDSICMKYPQVTLLKTPQSVGPYQIIQSLTTTNDFQAYLFQDSDDWSTPERLEQLLNAAVAHGAEIVGCQELRLDYLSASLYPVLYPLDVQAALVQAPGHALLHPTSLVSRFAINAVGGFANGLRFGGDTEFLLRAYQRVRAINIPYFGYFRRKHPKSLTTSPQTGLDSPQRLKLLQTLKARARLHQELQHQHHPVNLQPLCQIPPIQLTYCCGPRLF